MTAYYNELDPFAAQWLRNLINAGHIAPGIVDERSIEDVFPSDLRGFTQCHFFAGIGVWSHALRLAGWSDSRPVWTGSCPCQPFSAAGQGAGFDDERHLWPHWHHLIKECRPAVILGEQVASRDAAPWLDLVQDDVEALGYAFGAVPFPAAGVGAPHIRDRLYWVADSTSTGPQGRQRSGERTHAQRAAAERGGAAGRMADADCPGCRPGRQGCEAMGHGPATQPDCGTGGLADPEQHSGRCETESTHSRQPQVDRPADQHGRHSGAFVRLADAEGSRRREECEDAGRRAFGDRAQGVSAGLERGGGDSRTGPLHGFWRDADWLLCRDGKWRPVEPGTFPLVDGAPARVGRLRAYGNAIVAPQAQAFVEAVMDCVP